MKTFFRKTIVVFMLIALNMTLAMAQSTVKHVVDKGETLTSIAQKYGVTKEKIVELNPEAAQFIYVGMELVVPATTIKLNETEAVTSQPTSTNDYSITQNHENIPISPQNIKEDGSTEGMEYLFLIRPKDKTYGYHMGYNYPSHLCIAIDLSYCFAKDAYVGCVTFGIGAGGKYKIGSILLQGNIYPYAGINSYSVPEIKVNSTGKTTSSSKTKTDFMYGIAADIGAGLKIYENKSGGGTYLTVGYYCAAPKLETQDMVKNGDWMIGITVEM